MIQLSEIKVDHKVDLLFVSTDYSLVLVRLNSYSNMMSKGCKEGGVRLIGRAVIRSNTVCHIKDGKCIHSRKASPSSLKLQK